MSLGQRALDFGGMKCRYFGRFYLHVWRFLCAGLPVGFPVSAPVCPVCPLVCWYLVHPCAHLCSASVRAIAAGGGEVTGFRYI